MSKIVQFGSGGNGRNRKPQRSTRATASSAIGSAEDSAPYQPTPQALFAYPQFIASKSAKWLDGTQAFAPTFELFAALDEHGRPGQAVVMEFTAEELIEFRTQIDRCLAKCGTEMLADVTIEDPTDDE